MKRIAIALLSLSIFFTMTACKNKNISSDNSDNSQKDTDSITDIIISSDTDNNFSTDSTVSSNISSDNASYNSNNTVSEVNSSSGTETSNLTSNDINEILLNHFGEYDSETGNKNLFFIEDNMIDYNSKEYFVGKYSWLIEDHTSFISFIAVSDDGKNLYLAEYDNNNWTIDLSSEQPLD